MNTDHFDCKDHGSQSECRPQKPGTRPREWIHQVQRHPATHEWEVADEDGAPNFRLPGDWRDEVIDKQDVGRASSLA